MCTSPCIKTGLGISVLKSWMNRYFLVRWFFVKFNDILFTKICTIFVFLYTSRECVSRSLLYTWTSSFFCTSPYTSPFPDSQSRACNQISPVQAITLSSHPNTQLLISLIFSILKQILNIFNTDSQYYILRKPLVTFAVILAYGRARPLHAKNAYRFENTKPND
jgi:hypothetical protein